jgi:hypothetical protein
MFSDCVFFSVSPNIFRRFSTCHMWRHIKALFVRQQPVFLSLHLKFDLVSHPSHVFCLAIASCKRLGIVYTVYCMVYTVGRDGSVGIAAGYGLAGPGIESWWGRDIPHPSRPALGPTQPPLPWYRVSLPGVKRPGRSADHPPHLAPRLKKE